MQGWADGATVEMCQRVEMKSGCAVCLAGDIFGIQLCKNTKGGVSQTSLESVFRGIVKHNRCRIFYCFSSALMHLKSPAVKITFLAILAPYR